MDTLTLHHYNTTTLKEQILKKCDITNQPTHNVDTRDPTGSNKLFIKYIQMAYITYLNI